MAHNIEGMDTTEIGQDADADYVVSFKGEFLDKLIDAVALIEVLEIALKHNQEIDINKAGFTGISILLEQIKGLLDINENLLHEKNEPSRAAPIIKLDS